MLHSALTLEKKGFGNDRHGEYIERFGYLCDNGSRSGAGAAAHTRGDEHHVGAFDGFGDLFKRFLGGFFADFRIAARAVTLGDPVADGDLGRCGRFDEDLSIGIDIDEFDLFVVERCDHAVNGISAAAADADDLDNYPVGIFDHISHIEPPNLTSIFTHIII